MALPKKDALKSKLREYIDSVLSSERKHPFPNLAGFCRHIGISANELFSLKKKRPNDFSSVMLELEDAALNSGATASLINLYLRQYGFWKPQSEDDIFCDHDMLEDGI